MAFASNQTSNYGLCQWEQTDLVIHSDFNEDNQKIDSALHSLQTEVDSKADQSALDSLSTTVSGKASTSTVNSLTTRVSNLESTRATVSQMNSAVNNVAADVDALDTARLRIVTGSYTGTGYSGSYWPKTLSFSGLNRTPELVIIRATNGAGDGLVLLRGMNSSTCNLSGTSGTGTAVTVTGWTQTSITWYADNTRACMNEEDTTYRYFILG